MLGDLFITDLMFVLGAAVASLVAPVYRLLMAKRGLDGSLPPLLPPLLSLAFGLLFAAAYWLVGPEPRLYYLLLMAVVCVLVFLSDLNYRLIPNPLVLAIFIITAVFALLGMEFDWLDSLLGMAVCLALFSLPAFWGRKVGMGDIKLAAAMGFAAGLLNGLFTVALMGMLILVWIRFRRIPLVDYLKTLIPMGPCLAASFLAVQVFRWF